MVRMPRVVVARLTCNYDHGGFDRLVAANDLDRIDQYAYDANGNQASRTEAGEIETCSIDARSNRLLSVAGDTAVDYSYDPNGNLVGDGTHSYTYSARNRLNEVVPPANGN